MLQGKSAKTWLKDGAVNVDVQKCKAEEKRKNRTKNRWQDALAKIQLQKNKKKKTHKNETNNVKCNGR